MTEEEKIHCAFVEYVLLKDPTEPFFHIPNGGKRALGEAIKFKKMHVVAGVADLYFMRFKTFVELKTKKGTWSKEQKAFSQWCRETNHYYITAQGLDAAIQWYDYQLSILYRHRAP